MNKNCPWCNHNLSLSRPGSIRLEDKKWKGISLYPRSVMVCPSCNNKVKVCSDSKRWLVLVLPLLAILLFRAWTLDHWIEWLKNMGVIEWSAVTTAFLGIVMDDIKTKYVKVE